MKSLLTPREQQIMELLINDLSQKQIAIELGISVGMVHNHLFKTRKKFGVRSNVAAVLKAIEAGLTNKKTAR